MCPVADDTAQLAAWKASTSKSVLQEKHDDASWSAIFMQLHKYHDLNNQR